MTRVDVLEHARASFGRRAWRDAYAQLSSAERAAPLGLEDLECLAVAAYLVGRDADSAEVWVRAHNECLRRGDAARAARCAFWLAFGLLFQGEQVHAGGWLARARRLLEDGQHDCAEQGYLLLPVALRSIDEGDAQAAHTAFRRATEIGDRFGELDLRTLGRLGCGQALIRLGKTGEGVALLDEAMVAVTVGEASPIVSGIVYCAVILACQEIFDLRRAREWTAALSRWCESQPDLVLYRGQCLVHRAEIMQLYGAWSDALDEVRRARHQCSQPPAQPVVGMACYRQAELHRLRGEFVKAEAAYREATKWGREPQPGLALLRLGQGQVDAAAAAIRRVVDEVQDRASRAKVLAPYVEIVLAAADVPAARAAAEELSEIAADLDAPLLHAVSAQAMGAVLLAEGAARAALDTLRRAWTTWQALEVPYEAARVMVRIGLARRALGDEDTAGIELDAACSSFRHLGAVPDLAQAEALSQKPAAMAPGWLTPREVEVLRLVAVGKTNHAIAAELFISEHTVARHVQNIFAKLGVASRTAAAAFAFEHRLL
jgi:DNA-binding NarL/FixJ family response regulator